MLGEDLQQLFLITLVDQTIKNSFGTPPILSTFILKIYFLTLSILYFLGLEAIVMSYIKWESHPGGLKMCSICGYSTQNGNDVKRHVESKHMRLRIFCKFCQTVCSTRRTLEYHLKKYHMEEVQNKPQTEKIAEQRLKLQRRDPVPPRTPLMVPLAPLTWNLPEGSC